MFKNESGFSLVELATAAAISVAVGALAISSFQNVGSTVANNASAGYQAGQNTIDDANSITAPYYVYPTAPAQNSAS
jgi:Tfp pilus assembly major pilin PilA